MANPKYKIQKGSIETAGDYTRMKVEFNGSGRFELWEMKSVDGNAVKTELAKVAKHSIDKSSPAVEDGVISPRDALEEDVTVTLTEAKLAELGL